MRTWRVGTISMGASLLLLGILLLVSQLFNFNLTNVLLSWWPIILVVLGIEILAFIFLSRQESPMLKYDLLSIFFVGIIGTVGIGLAIISSTGVLDLVGEAMQRETRTYDLPAYSKHVDDNIKRIVLNTGQYPIIIEGTNGQEVSMFGTYSAITAKNKKIISKTEDYVAVQQKADTLFLTVKALPTEMGLFNSNTDMEATILIPEETKLEIIGNQNSITMKPRTLRSDWSVENGSDIHLLLAKNSDVDVTAVGVQELMSQTEKWEIVQSKEANSAGANTEEPPSSKNGSFQLGKGIYSINIENVNQVSLSTLE